ncbi:virulence factor TspB C-terminal domain-related protein, partial [Vibrio splendidus]
DGSGGDGSGGNGSGGDGNGSGDSGSGSGSGGSGSGSGSDSVSVDLSGVISKLNQIKGSTDSIGTGIDGLGGKLDSIGTGIGGLGDKLDDIANGSNTDVSGNNCDVNNFSCSGNAYDCFIARQAWDNKCLISSLTGDIGTGEGVPIEHSQAVNESGNALINDLKDYTSNKGDVSKLSNGEVALSDTLSKYNESNGFNFDDRCPSPTQVNYGLGSFELNYQPFCDLALYIRAMLMLTASIGSVLMIAKHS